MKIDWEGLEPTIRKSCETYKGDITVLESAIGALVMGKLFGWRVLRIIHSGATYARYERILGVKFNLVCPDHTKLSRRSVGYRAVEEFGNYWKAINEGLLPAKERLKAE